MRNKAFLILIALCGLLMAATFGLWAYCSKLKSEKERLDGNQTALLEKVEFYQTESGKSAASVQALTLSKSEVEKHCADLTNTVKELDLKVKRLQAASILQLLFQLITMKHRHPSSAINHDFLSLK